MTLAEKSQQLLAAFIQEKTDNNNAFFSEMVSIIPALAVADRKIFSDQLTMFLDAHVNEFPINVGYGKYIQVACLFFTEDYETMLPLAFNGVQYFEDLGEEVGKGILYVLIGGAYRTLGDFDKGMKYTMEATQILEKTPYFGHVSIAAMYQYAGNLFDMKHYDQALDIYLKSYTKAKEIDSAIWIINTLNAIGLTYLRQKNYIQAKVHLEKAVQECETRGNHQTTSKALTDLGSYYAETGELQKAEELQSQALAIREPMKMSGGIITNLTELAEIKLKEKNYIQALEYAKKALDLAEQIKVKPKIYQMQLMLSKIYQQQGDFEKSLEHYKIYNTIKDEVEKEDAAKKIKNMQLIFEAEQTKKENIVIKKQKAEIEKKNIELQETIDELTRTKVGKKAKAFTLIIAIVLFILEEFIIHFVLHLIDEQNFYLSFVVKMVIIFSLKPIDNAIEHYLLHKIIKKEKKERLEVMV